jgi:hypothetical protein
MGHDNAPSILGPSLQLCSLSTKLRDLLPKNGDPNIVSLDQEIHLVTFENLDPSAANQLANRQFWRIFNMHVNMIFAHYSFQYTHIF